MSVLVDIPTSSQAFLQLQTAPGGHISLDRALTAIMGLSLHLRRGQKERCSLY